MTEVQILILIGIFAVSLWLTRFLPFLVFRNLKKLPKIVDYLGKVLPAAMMGLLVVYCLKDYTFTDLHRVIPLGIALLVVVLLHLWKRNTILSISVGTVLYMVCIRVM